MIVCRYSPRATSAPGTFAARLDGDVLLVTAHLRRSDVAGPLTLTFPCAFRDDTVSLRARRVWAEAFTVQIRFGPGDTETLHLIEVPETILNDWERATRGG